MNGSVAAADTITVSPTAVLGHAIVSGGPDVSTTEDLTVNGLGGDDTISGGAVVGLFELTLDGGVGNDILNGGNGNDILVGGSDGDTVDGNVGADVALLGTGDDAFVWDPGDGSDIVEGGTDRDELRFNGSAGAEIFTASANGSRLLFTRNIGNIVIDADDVETLTVHALGGADTATVDDLSATDVESVDIDLGVAGVGDVAIDSVTVNATNNANVVRISGASGGVSVLSPYLAIGIVDAEPANDSLIVNASTGADLVSAAALASTSVLLALNGSTGRRHPGRGVRAATRSPAGRATTTSTARTGTTRSTAGRIPTRSTAAPASIQRSTARTSPTSHERWVGRMPLFGGILPPQAERLLRLEVVLLPEVRDPAPQPGPLRICRPEVQATPQPGLVVFVDGLGEPGEAAGDVRLGDRC